MDFASAFWDGADSPWRTQERRFLVRNVPSLPAGTGGSICSAAIAIRFQSTRSAAERDGCWPTPLSDSDAGVVGRRAARVRLPIVSAMTQVYKPFASRVRQRTNIMATQHWLMCWTHRWKREVVEGGLGQGVRHMPMKAETLNPETADLVSAAFDKSWQFVRTDPALAHSDMDEMRIRLSRRLMRLAQDGERDMLRLANGAIGQLRREQRVA
jgi:hypothetical protein